MMRTLAFIGLMATTALGLTIDKRFAEYKFSDEPLTWGVDAFNNGTLYNMTGTIQQVYAQIAKINPYFKLPVSLSNNIQQGDGIPLPPMSPGGVADTPEAFCYNTLHATWGWNAGSAPRIQEGIDYLRGVSGQPQSDPGPGTCNRVSCSYNSAIYWCNDNTAHYSLPNFAKIADCAQVAHNVCQYEDEWLYYDVLGQHFEKDNWNCVVRWDRDNC